MAQEGGDDMTFEDLALTGEELLHQARGSLRDAANAATRKVLRLIEPILDSLVDWGDCSVDHHGYCQVHLQSACMMPEARRLIALVQKEAGE